MNNTSTILNFFRINRLLSYVVLSMVLPSIAWPASGLGGGEDYSRVNPASPVANPLVPLEGALVDPLPAGASAQAQPGHTSTTTRLDFSLEVTTLSSPPARAVAGALGLPDSAVSVSIEVGGLNRGEGSTRVVNTSAGEGTSLSTSVSARLIRMPSARLSNIFAHGATDASTDRPADALTVPVAAATSVRTPEDRRAAYGAQNSKRGLGNSSSRGIARASDASPASPDSSSRTETRVIGTGHGVSLATQSSQRSLLARNTGSRRVMDAAIGVAATPTPIPRGSLVSQRSQKDSRRFTGVNPMAAVVGAGRAPRSSMAGLGLAIARGAADSKAVPEDPSGLDAIPDDSRARVRGYDHTDTKSGTPSPPKGKPGVRGSLVSGDLVGELEEGTPLSPADLETLKPLNTYMLREFNPNITRRDVIQYIATFVLTGALCIELWGEARMIIDRSFTALLAKSPEMVQYLLYDADGVHMKAWVSNLIIANSVIALVPYLPYRLYKAVRLVTPGVEWALNRMCGLLKPYILGRRTTAYSVDTTIGQKTLAKKGPLWANMLGQALVLVGAVANGAMPAYVSYNTNYSFSNGMVYAHTVPAFLFIFYTIDYFLRLQTLKNKIFNKLFVSRGDLVAKERVGLIDRLREAKHVILKQKSSDLLKLYGRLAALSEKGENSADGMARGVSGGASASASLKSDEGIDQLKILLGLVKPKAHVAEKPKSTMYYVRQYGPLLWAAIVCMCGAYLVGRVSYSNFGGSVQYLATGQPASTLLDQITLNEAINYADASVNYYGQESILWPNATANVTVYNGNNTDWCWQCLNPDNYQLGDESDPTAVTINLLRCPGVIPTGFVGPYAAAGFVVDPAAGALEYNGDNCEGIFGYMSYLFEDYDPTGETYFQQYLDQWDPHLDPTLNITSYTLTTGGQVVAGGGAFVSALAVYGMGILATTGFLKRWIDSYRSHPEDVLPGKRNVYLTTATMGWALLQSLFRSTPVLISGWIAMKNDSINQGFMWTILASAMFTGAATFFPDFDETYSHLPKWIGSDVPRGMLGAYNWVKRIFYGLQRRRPEDITFKLFGKKAGDLVFPKRDKILIKIDRLRDALAGADENIIKALVRGLGNTFAVADDGIINV